MTHDSGWFSLRRLLALIAALAVVAGLYIRRDGLSWRGATPLQIVPQDADLAGLVDQHMTGVARTFIAEHPPDALPFKWGEGVLMLGLDCAAQRARDEAARAEIDGYVRAYYEAHPAVVFAWSDDVTPAIAAATRLARGESARRQVVDDAIDYVLNAPRTPVSGAITHFGRSDLRHLAPPLPDAWVDTLFHVVPLLVRHGQMVNASRELDEAAEQQLRFMRAVQDPHNGLVTHAFSERDGKLELEPPLSAEAYWLRGQGWVLYSGVEAWGALAEGHPLRAELAQRVQRLARALLAYQAPSGLFHTLVTRADTYEETAGSALVIAALARGARGGLLDAEASNAARRGMRGLIAIVDQYGARYAVTGTSLGTNPWPAIYEWVPTASQVSYGVGAWLIAACAVVSTVP